MSCVLFGNVGKVLGGIIAFNEAKPDDGWLEVGLVTAKGLAQWVRIAGRTAVGQPERSPFVRRPADVRSTFGLIARWRTSSTGVIESPESDSSGDRACGDHRVRAGTGCCMSSANAVPETRDLSEDDAWETLSRTGRLRLVSDAFRRFRAADGFSHARSMALIAELVLVQGLIALVGLASAIHRGGLSDLIVRTLKTAAPGPAGTVLTDAVDQAHRAGASHRYLALTIGVVGALISGMTLMGQMERGLNRIYGIERDRSTLRKYGRALLLAMSAGLFISAAFAAIAFGRQIARSLGTNVAVRIGRASDGPQRSCWPRSRSRPCSDGVLGASAPVDVARVWGDDLRGPLGRSSPSFSRCSLP